MDWSHWTQDLRTLGLWTPGLSGLRTSGCGIREGWLTRLRIFAELGRMAHQAERILFFFVNFVYHVGSYFFSARAQARGRRKDPDKRAKDPHKRAFASLALPTQET